MTIYKTASESSQQRYYFDAFYKKERKKVYFYELNDFKNRIGETVEKIVLSIGNGNKSPIFENQIISDISFEGIKKVDSRRKVVLDCHSLPFKKDSIDIIFGWQVVHHLSLDKFLSQVKFTLKSGGKCVFVDNGYSPHWRIIRNLFPKKKNEPAEDMSEDLIYQKIEEYGFKKFDAKRYNFFAYLFSKTFRELGINLSINILGEIDQFFSRWEWFRRNLRNMVWSFEK
ncbi:MAG: methyltransferase domain-containing protein [Patescibacteria group bacterium]